MFSHQTMTVFFVTIMFVGALKFIVGLMGKQQNLGFALLFIALGIVGLFFNGSLPIVKQVPPPALRAQA